MSGIAQIIQAMMSVTPQVTPMGQGFAGGGGGGGGISLGGTSNVAMNPMQRPSQPQQQGPQRQMPEITPLNPMQQQIPPGYPGSQQMGPPDPQQAYQREGQPGIQALERQWFEANQRVEQLLKPRTPKDAWAARKELPEAQRNLAAAESNIAAYNAQQQADAADQRYQRAREILEDNNVPPQQADPIARQAAVDEQAFQELMQMAMSERESVNQLGRDQQEEFRDETDIAYALPLIVPGVDEETAMGLAASGESLTELVNLLVGDEERAQERLDEWNKSQTKIRDSLFEADQAILTTEKALADVGVTTAGIGSYLQDFRGLPAKDLHEALETLRAMQGFKALYDMRQASPTGGALGNVSNMEVKLLYSAWTNLNQGQSPSRLRENLNEVLDRYNRVKFLIEQEQEGNLKGVNAVKQKEMADLHLNQTRMERFRDSRPATADRTLEMLKSGQISKQDFEDKFGFLPVPGTY